MGLIVIGRRAARYLPLARKKLAELREQAPSFLKALIGLPAGFSIVKKVGPVDNILIKVRDPYIAVAMRHRTEAGALAYRPYFGGEFDEPFEPDVEAMSGAPSIKYAGVNQGWFGRGIVVETFMTGTYVLGFSHTESGHTTEVQPEGDMLLGVTSYKHNFAQIMPVGYRVIVNMTGQPIIQHEPFGDYAAGASMMATKAIVGAATGYYYHIILRMQEALDLVEPTLIWPPAAINGSHPELVVISSPLTCCGRGKLAFLINFAADWREIVLAAPPEVVVMDGFGATHARTPLLTIDPTLATPLGAEYELNVGSDLIYSGEGHLAMLLNMQGGTTLRMYKCFVAVGTWSAVTLPAMTATETLYVPGFDGHTAYSMFIGHIEFITTDSLDGTVRRYMSLDHGATWAVTALVANEIMHRGRATACVLKYKEDGTPAKYATVFNQTDADSPTNPLTRLRVIADFDSIGQIRQRTVSRSADFIDQPGDSTLYYSNLCFFGSEEYPAPLLPGFPNELEYPA